MNSIYLQEIPTYDALNLKENVIEVAKHLAIEICSLDFDGDQVEKVHFRDQTIASNILEEVDCLKQRGIIA